MRATVGFSAPSAAAATTSPPSSSTHLSIPSHSVWHSPVPYLFGGLASMLGLIAFALLILACSYSKLSGYLDAGDDVARDDSGAGDKEAAAEAKPQPCYEQRIVVIMAGDDKPTFLAMPISSRVSSFGYHGTSSADGSSSNSDGDGDGDGEDEGKKVESGEGVELGIGSESVRQEEDEQNRGNDQSTQSQEQYYNIQGVKEELRS